MKLIFITDTHGMASNPGSRLDNFSEALLEKMRYVGEYAEHIGARAILHGGDWLHTPDVSENFIREFSNIIKGYKCPVFGILGNHDIYGYNPETFNRTAFSIAEVLGTFHRLGKEPVCIEDYNERVYITGQDAYYDLDKPGHIDDYSRSEIFDDGVNIHIVHGMLVEREWPQVSCTTIQDVMDDVPNADIILTGHEHTGFGVKQLSRPDGVNDVLFCNPGSLARITASTGDIRKDCRMAVITIENGDYDIELVNLPVHIARPASEVIDIEKLAQEKANKEKLNGFINQVQDINLNKSFNVYQSLSSLCEDESIADDVIDECRSQLQKAEEYLQKEE